MPDKKIPRWLWETGISLLLTTVAISLTPQEAIASEKITFTYGIASQSLEIEELDNFAATGEISPTLNFLLNHSNQNPLMIRWLLTQKFPADIKLIYDFLNTAPGEYVLTQTSNIVNSDSERANVKALRGALIAAASDDHQISLLELLHHYPTKQVYVDGKALSKVRRNLWNFIEQISKSLQLPLGILQSLLNVR